MKIAMLCPLDTPVAVDAAGPNRDVALLATGLVAAGHEVTLFAAEGSTSAAELVASPAGTAPAAHAARALAASRNQDLLHNHAGAAVLPWADAIDVPVLTTLHAAPDAADLDTLRGSGAALVAGVDGLELGDLPVRDTVVPGPTMVEQYVRLYAQLLAGRENYRPWGHYVVLEDAPRHKVKRIVVLPGQRLSLQLHHRRAEHWLVIEGEGLVTLDDDEVLVRAGEAIDIGQGTRHRIRNPLAEPMAFIEVQTGDYFGEDDIVRFEDDYGRSTPTGEA